VGLLTLPLRLPLLPVQGVIRLAQMIDGEAQRQLRDPARIRRMLEEAERKHAAGEISDEELASVEEQVTGLLIPQEMPAGDAAGDDGI
jgi:hypothetical protein